MEQLIAGLIASIGGVFVVAMVAFWWLVSMALPFMVLSMMRSLRRIAIQLERQSTAPPQTARAAEPEIGPWRPSAAAPSLGHQLLK